MVDYNQDLMNENMTWVWVEPISDDEEEFQNEL